MDVQKPSNGVLDKFGVERAITDWVIAIENFRLLYVKLVSLLPHHAEKLGGPSYVGQCPTDSLVTLTLRMQKELEQLLGEMDTLDGLTTQTSSQTLLKLIRHTNRLNKLIEKAQVLLQLVSVSSS